VVILIFSLRKNNDSNRQKYVCDFYGKKVAQNTFRKNKTASHLHHFWAYRFIRKLKRHSIFVLRLGLLYLVLYSLL